MPHTQPKAIQSDILSNRAAAATVGRVAPNALMDFRFGKSVLWSSRSTSTGWIRLRVILLHGVVRLVGATVSAEISAAHSARQQNDPTTWSRSAGPQKLLFIRVSGYSIPEIKPKGAFAHFMARILCHISAHKKGRQVAAFAIDQGDDENSVRDVESRAVIADRQVNFVPFFLSVTIGVRFEGGCIGELHDDGVSSLSLGFDGRGPDVSDALIRCGQGLGSVERRFDLVRHRASFPSDSDNVNQ